MVDEEDRLDVSFVQKKIFVGSDLSLDAESIIAQLFGFYSLLNSVRDERDLDKNYNFIIYFLTKFILKRN